MLVIITAKLHYIEPLTARYIRGLK